MICLAASSFKIVVVVIARSTVSQKNISYSKIYRIWKSAVKFKEIEIIHRFFLVIAMFCQASSIGLLICTLISENQGLEKSRSYSNLRKISGPANLDFFQFVTWIFFSSLLCKPSFFLGLHLENIL